MATLLRQRIFSAATRPSIRVVLRALNNNSTKSSATTPSTTSNITNNSNSILRDQQPEGSPTPLLPEFAVNGNGNGNGEGLYDWSRSYYGLSAQAFSREVSDILLAPIDSLDIEIKPDGLLYLPEIKYRRILNKAFGPGGWGLAPRGETNVGPKIVSREYALVCQGRLVAIARGEQEYFDPSGIPTATEGCKSNALMRCSKDLGIASELWDPRFIREFKQQQCVEVFAEHLPTKKKKKLWRRKDQPKLSYPYQE
ncbi:hypothetical protein APHAL10511_001614 [Amanita phalloides]|nr:hypothetical protein APHAL10511_001614 [Amanita phalloides]